MRCSPHGEGGGMIRVNSYLGGWRISPAGKYNSRCPDVLAEKQTSRWLRLDCRRWRRHVQSVLHKKCVVHGGDDGEDERGAQEDLGCNLDQ